MKHLLVDHQRSRLLAIGLVLVASAALPITSSFAGEQKDSPGFVEKMKQWQDKMSDKFRDTWRGWRGKQGEQSVGAASVDLREQKDSYTLRMNLPNRDLAKVEIKLEGDSLRIVAPAEKNAGRYEQVLSLSQVAPNARPVIERRPEDNLIVVTVPKGGSLAESKPPADQPGLGLGPLADWERDVFARMEKMRRDMDRIFEESFGELRLTPEYKGMFDRPRFGSSIDLQEEGDNYVVRAYLPDRDMQNVNVTIEGQTLTIEAKAEKTDRSADQTVLKANRAHYAQVITLPRPVQTDKMKVDKKPGMVVVTVPKA